MIFLIGGKNKESSRKALLDLKKNYSPEAIQTTVLDASFEGSLEAPFSAQSLFGGKPLVIFELNRDWKKFEESLVKSLGKAASVEVDALLWIDGTLPKNSRLYKTVAELGGKVVFFEEEGISEIWPLLEALANKDRPRAFSRLQSLLAKGESGIGILVMITYLTRNLLAALYQNDYFKSLAPFQRKKLLTQVKNFTEDELLEIYSYLLSLDMALKGSPLSEELLLSHLIFGYTDKRENK